MADFKFEPMRSLIYVNVAKEDFRPNLERWLYKTHIPDSISQFEPSLKVWSEILFSNIDINEASHRFKFKICP